MAGRLAEAVSRGDLDRWDQRRWATLWLAVPRSNEYRGALKVWDAVFRSLPAFELAEGNLWKAVSLDALTRIRGEIYVAPLQEEKADDVVWAAVRLLRNTGRNVIRGVRKDKGWMRFSSASFATTADLITTVFAGELPPLKPIAPIAQQILSEIAAVAPLFAGPPPVEIVRLGKDSPPALRLHGRLVLNVDHPAGAAIVSDALGTNTGAASLIGIVALRSYEHLSQVAASVREISYPAEILSPIRRRYIRGKL